MGAYINTSRNRYFNVNTTSGNGHLYFYISDTADLLTVTGDIRFRLEQALTTFKSTYTAYTGIDITDGRFLFNAKGLVFTGLSGTNVNPNGSGNGLVIVTDSQA